MWCQLRKVIRIAPSVRMPARPSFGQTRPGAELDGGERPIVFSSGVSTSERP